MEFPFFISACTVLRTLFPLLKYLSDERERKEKKRRKNVTLFANAFLAFFISRVSPPAAPFSSPFPRIRLRLCSFILPREKRIFFQDSRVLSSVPFSSFLSFSSDETSLSVFSFSILHISSLHLLSTSQFRSLFFQLRFCLYICPPWNQVVLHQLDAKRCRRFQMHQQRKMITRKVNTGL